MHVRSVLCLSLTCAALVAQGPAPKKSNTPHASHRTVLPESLKWGPPPEGAVKGQPPADFPAMRSQFAVVEGDPSKPGSPFVVRIKAPDGEKVPPHWHPTDEHLTVIQGTFVLEDGEKYSDGGTELKAGSYVTVPRNMWHHGHIKGETMLQIHGTGPFVMNFVPLP